MAGSDKRKQSLYFPEDMLKEIQDEATRQDRSLSWIVQKAWKIARKEIMKYPSVNEFPGEEDEKEIAEGKGCRRRGGTPSLRAMAAPCFTSRGGSEAMRRRCSCATESGAMVMSGGI